MQDVGLHHNVIYLPVASNDNEDLLAFTFPLIDLAFVRELKNDLKLENAETGILLQSRKQRRFFQEVIDAERYILMRYFSRTPEDTVRALKRYILDHYLFPKAKKRKARKKPEPA